MIGQRGAIRKRVNRAVFGGVGLALFLTLMTTFVLQDRFFDEEAKMELSTFAQVVAAGVEPAIIFNQSEDALPVLERLRRETEVSETHVFLAKTDELFFSHPSHQPAPAELLRRGTGFYPADEGMWFVDELRDETGEVIGTVVLRSSLRMLRDKRQQSIRVLIGLAAIMLLVARWLSQRLSKELTEPLVSLADTVKRVEAEPGGDLRARKVSDDEIGVLADGINRMLDSLKEQADALRVNEERLLEAQAVAGLGNWVFHHESGRIDWFNEVYAIFETKREDFDHSMKSLNKLVHPDDREELGRLFAAAVEEHKLYDCTHRICLPDDRIKWVHERGRTIYDADGKPLRTIGTVQDVTERMLKEQEIRELNASLERRVEDRTRELKQAGERLRASEERLTFLIASSPAVTYSASLQTVFAPAYVSHNVYERLGYAPDEFGDASFWSDHLHPEDRESALETWSRVGTEDEVVHEYRFRTQDGEYRWLRDEVKLVRDAKARPLEVVGCWVDVTELKAAEAEREQLINELKNKNTELEQFTYTVSHDLKSPLITIKGFLGVLEADLENNPAQAREDMERIGNAADHMTELLNDLLELSRIGRVCNPAESVELGVLAASVANNLSGPLEQGKVRLDLQPDLPAVHGDRIRISEVLQNLVENAVKYMGDQEEPRIEIGARRRNREMPEIFVRDNGMGIDPARQDKIFALFHKVDRKSQGTGVGLALVKRIVEFHGGRVWVESDGRGQGSTFVFSLPSSDGNSS